MKITELHTASGAHVTIDAEDYNGTYPLLEGMTAAQSLRQYAAELHERQARMLKRANRLQLAAEQLEQAE